MKNLPTRWTFYPLLFGLYAPLALLAHNIEEVPVSSALRSIFLALAAAATLFVLISWALKDRHKGALVSAAALLVFFSYGHLYTGIKLFPPLASILGRHRFLAPLLLALLAGFGLWVTRQKRSFQPVTRALNAIAVVALAFPLLGIANFLISNYTSPEPEALQAPGKSSPGGSRPDIYYIILDAYSRDDTLKHFYDYDNSAFLKALEDLGFYVARCSRSNYAQTQLSLASSLNFNYVQALGEKYSDPGEDRRGLPGFIRRSALRQYLEAQGYQTVAFETGFHWTQITDASLYLAPNASPVVQMGIAGGANEFEVMLMRTSAGLLVADAAIVLPAFLQPDLDYPQQEHRERVLYILDQLATLPRAPGPKFVFAHIVSPHKPFVFGPNGEIMTKGPDEITGYRDQVNYLNQRLLPLVEQILRQSPTPPVIILQGDHGGVDTGKQDRMRILNAYYLPQGAEALYEGISPVNTFRVVLNQAFGEELPLLEDVSYFSNYKRPFDFEPMPETRAGCESGS